jgi:menaquinone-9 beta-reductase
MPPLKWIALRRINTNNLNIKNENHNLVIVGAGPAGATASAFLSKEKINHILLDKAIFPRDKICGDALSGKIIPVLKKLDPNIIEEMRVDTKHFTGSYGIKFASPNGKSFDIPFNKNLTADSKAPGFISRRFHFDNFLLKKTDPAFAEIRQGHTLLSCKRNDEKILLTISDGSENYTISTSLVIAAEGERSIVARTLSDLEKSDEHFCAGIRSYYTGVTGMHHQNFIELHFIRELLPGYFWIFPLPGGFANVGAGMLSTTIKKKKINLKEAMLKAIAENTTIKDRFTNALPEGKIQGWGLPLGSVKRKISGDNFLLTGDAASMIDPFSGEGISNAMYCGMAAATAAKNALHTGNYNSSFLMQYDEQVYKRLWDEMRLSHAMQKLCNYPWMFNFIINKAEKSTTFRETISCMFDDLDLRSRFKQPSFYLKLLLNR